MRHILLATIVAFCFGGLVAMASSMAVTAKQVENVYLDIHGH